MSRSQPTTYIEEDTAVVDLTRYSKYSDQANYIPKVIAEIEDADSHYNRWDLDLEGE